MNSPSPEISSLVVNNLDLQRRTKLLRTLAAGMAGLVGLTLVSLWFSPSLSTVAVQVIALLTAGLAYWLAPRQMNLGTFILIGGFTIGVITRLIAADDIQTANLGLILSFLVIGVLAVGMLLGTRGMWLMTGLTLLIIAGAAGWVGTRQALSVAMGNVVLIVGVAGITWLFLQGIAEGQVLLNARNAALEQADRERSQLLTELEARAREAEVQRGEALRLLDDLRHSQQTATLLQSTVQQLATPALVVAPQVLAVPLIGVFDPKRAAQLQEIVLSSIERLHAHTVILDVTGVSDVDAAVAHTLIHMAQAAQLLGARCILAGVQPAVAHALVQLGVTLPDLHPTIDLQSALALALR